jgi:hypothetical protein
MLVGRGANEQKRRHEPMSPKQPLPPGLRPGGAADSESDLERRLYVTSAAQSQLPSRLRQQRAVERVCKISRVASELLAEIGRVHGIDDDIAARLQRYAELDHDLLAALGANQFPASPTRQIWERS